MSARKPFVLEVGSYKLKVREDPRVAPSTLQEAGRLLDEALRSGIQKSAFRDEAWRISTPVPGLAPDDTALVRSRKLLWIELRLLGLLCVSTDRFAAGALASGIQKLVGRVRTETDAGDTGVVSPLRRAEIDTALAAVLRTNKPFGAPRLSAAVLETLAGLIISEQARAPINGAVWMWTWPELKKLLNLRATTEWVSCCRIVLGVARLLQEGAYPEIGGILVRWVRRKLDPAFFGETAEWPANPPIGPNDLRPADYAAVLQALDAPWAADTPLAMPPPAPMQVTDPADLTTIDRALRQAFRRVFPLGDLAISDASVPPSIRLAIRDLIAQEQANPGLPWKDWMATWRDDWTILRSMDESAVRARERMAVPWVGCCAVLIATAIQLQQSGNPELGGAVVRYVRRRTVPSTPADRSLVEAMPPFTSSDLDGAVYRRMMNALGSELFSETSLPTESAPGTWPPPAPSFRRVKRVTEISGPLKPSNPNAPSAGEILAAAWRDVRMIPIRPGETVEFSFDADGQAQQIRDRPLGNCEICKQPVLVTVERRYALGAGAIITAIIAHSRSQMCLENQDAETFFRDPERYAESWLRALHLQVAPILPQRQSPAETSRNGGRPPSRAVLLDPALL